MYPVQSTLTQGTHHCLSPSTSYDALTTRCRTQGKSYVAETRLTPLFLSTRYFVPGAKNFARDAPRSRPDYHRRVTRAGYRRSALTHEQVRPTTSDGLQPLLAAKRTGASTRSRLVIRPAMK